MMNRAENATSAIPGIVSVCPNNHVSSIKSDPWPQVLLLMGNAGEKMMVDLLLDCGLFVEVASGCETYHQLSGKFARNYHGNIKLTLLGLPLSDLQTLPESTDGKSGSVTKTAAKLVSAVEHSPSNINFVRSRMLYARAALNAQGGVRFGLRHIREF
jgi:telomerase reverse transcriptase